ncbi:MAG: hypothetical protein M8857_09770 [marine benthic group bacterium]|nr:hypothetical protein [Gemmatimonadota bacterium]
MVVHGLGRTPASMALLAERLEGAGYRVVNFGYPSRSEPIEDLVDRLEAELGRCCRNAEDSVHFVTHSMGGVLVRALLARREEPHLGRVVMLSPPNQGSEIVDAFADTPVLRAILGPAGVRLGTDAGGIADQLPPVRFELGIITGDRSLDPIGSWLIPGPDDGKVAVENARVEGAADFRVIPASHTFIMNRPDVAEEVVHFLQTGRFQPSKADRSRYLYVWAGAEHEGDSDFLAVIDADPESEAYGEIVATLPVGLKGGAHHSEHVMPHGDTLYVNAFTAGASFLIDLSDPLEPRLAGSFREMGEFTYPHTFERLPDGNVLVTFQTKGEGNEIAGGLVELDPAGRLVRSADAADPVDPELRAYSVTPIPSIDRAVSTTTDMRMEANGTSFQVWGLSDLTLLKTVPLPPGPSGHEHRDPAEVRLLPDSATAILTTFSCSMYLLHGLDTDAPGAELVYTLPWATYDTDECGIPLTRGGYWIQTYAHSTGSALVSLDISDPTRPVEVDRLTLEGDWWPHWVSIEPEGDRIVLTSGPGETLYRVLVIRLDPATGELSLDPTFRDPGADRPGVSFDRISWPHGTAGPARPHGAVFSREHSKSDHLRGEVNP